MTKYTAAAEGEFAKFSKQGYPIIYRGKLAPVLFRADAHDPYVVASGYDVESGEWAQGSYLVDLEVAMAKADGEPFPVEIEPWSPDPDVLREATMALVAAPYAASYHERYEVAATEWYVQCYMIQLEEFTDTLRANAGIHWEALDNNQRTSLLASVAYHHCTADWDLVSSDLNFSRRMEAGVIDDIASDPNHYLNLLND